MDSVRVAATIVAMDRREQVRAWLTRRERLGLTFRELSAETGVPVGTLAHWAWRLRQIDARGAAPSKRRRTRHSGSRFVELVAATARSSARVEIALAGDRRVIVERDFDEEHLVRVVRALERC